MGGGIEIVLGFSSPGTKTLVTPGKNFGAAICPDASPRRSPRLLVCLTITTDRVISCSIVYRLRWPPALLQPRCQTGSLYVLSWVESDSLPIG